MNKAGKYRYLLYGWTVGSNVPFPGIPETDAAPEIFVRIVNKIIQDDSYFSFTIGRIGDFYISKEEIILNPFCSRSEIVPYILGTAFGALIHKRNMIVLHGSAVQFGNSSVIFSGMSGAGKSTLSAACIINGHKILSDDVCVISMNDTPLVHPSYPQVKLWLDASEKIDADWSGKYEFSMKEGKFLFSAEKHFFSGTLPVNHMYILHRGYQEILIKEIKGAEKFDVLTAQTYRPVFVKKMSREKDHFNQMASLADKIKVFNLFYPDNFDKIELVTKRIKTHIDEYGSK